MAKSAPVAIVVAPTLDAHLAQAALGAEETLSLGELTLRMFGSLLPVQLARAAAAALVLQRRRRAVVTRAANRRTIASVSSSDQMVGAYMQLDSCMFLMIYTIENPL